MAGEPAYAMRYADGTPKYSAGELKVGGAAPDFEVHEVAHAPEGGAELQLRPGRLFVRPTSAGSRVVTVLDFGSFS